MKKIKRARMEDDIIILGVGYLIFLRKGTWVKAVDFFENLRRCAVYNDMLVRELGS